MDTTRYLAELDEAVAAIAARMGDRKPHVAAVLGSGLGAYANTLDDAVTIPYGEIPHFPVSTVAGHAGELVITGDVVVMKGRVHLYEGHDPSLVTFPLRALVKLGVDTVLLTNAAGGVNRTFHAGDLMLISDHVNFMGKNPLSGPNIDELGPRFPDMSEVYDKKLRALAHRMALEEGVTLREGIYWANLGPTYETPAEVRMAALLGADAVGMSTVPEAIVARHAGCKVLAISCITNLAAGISPVPLSHEEVSETAARVRPLFVGLVHRIITALAS